MGLSMYLCGIVKQTCFCLSRNHIVKLKGVKEVILNW